MSSETTVEAPPDTKSQIIEVAQRLFAKDGFEAVSLRHITAEAGVNVAAVNYHFGSKEALIDAVVERRIRPINEERLRLLDELEVKNPDGVPIEDVLRAMMWPLLMEVRQSKLGELLFYKLMGRCLSDRGLELPPTLKAQFHEVVVRFSNAIRKGRPDLSEREVIWRLHFAAGVLIQTLIHSDVVEQITEQRFEAPSAEETFEHMVAFCAAGFSAAPTSTEKKGGAE